MTVGAKATAQADWSYEDGTVDDICLSGSERGGGYTGRAHFRISGAAGLQVKIIGYVQVGADVLFFEVASAGGSLTLTCTAGVRGAIDQLVEVDFDPKKPLKGLRLATDIELSALAEVGVDLSAEAGIEVLGYDLWKAEWPSVFAVGRGYAWNGGLSFDNSFIPKVELGSFERAAPHQLQSVNQPGRSSPGRAARRASSRSIPIRKLIEEAIKGESGDNVHNGQTCDTALPISWFKPQTLYPETLVFDRAVNPSVDPISVERDAGPTLVSHDPVSRRGSERIVGPTWIGPEEDAWPDSFGWSNCFQFVEKTGASSRRESTALRRLLDGLGWKPSSSGTQIDHIRELQFGGADRFDNLWPFDKSANPSAGRYHQAQINAFRKLVSNDLNDRWMRVVSIGLEPDFEPKWAQHADEE